jgi:CRP-like cAMP-binding protein
MNEKIKKQLITFFNKYKLIKYKKGQIIFKPGEKLPGILFDKSGYFRVYTMSKDGKEITLPMLKPMFFCSMVDSLLNKENKYYIEAISPVELWLASEKEFMEFIKSDSDLYDKLTKVMLTDFIDLTNNVSQLIFGDAYTKIAGLVYSMSEKFGETKNKDTTIGFNTPHRMLASMTGLTRETVTLQLLRLQKEGFLYSKGRKIVVRDMNKLKEIAQV